MKNPPLLELLHSIFAAFPMFVPESSDDTCCNCFNNARRITAFEIIKSTILCREIGKEREGERERERERERKLKHTDEESFLVQRNSQRNLFSHI